MTADFESQQLGKALIKVKAALSYGD